MKSVEPGSPAAEAGIEAGQYIATENRPAYFDNLALFTEIAINAKIAELPEGSDVRLRTANGQTFSLGQKTASQASLEDFGLRLKVKKQMYVKRLIAIGGQTIQIRGGNLYVDGEELEGERFDNYYYSDNNSYQYGVEPTLVPEGHYFMLGDNSGNSADSRYWGFVPQKDIVGVPYLRVWPLNRFGIM